jgi:tetratricopeptide (TPR) repeat protein
MPTHASNKNHRVGWKRRIGTAATVGVLAALALAARVPMGPASGQDALLQGLLAGQKSLQAGMNTWDPVQFLAARDQFLGLLIGQNNPAKIYPYHVGLADFRLATYYLATGNTAEAGRFAVEGESYFEMAAKSDPKFAEALALQGYLLGLEAALHPDQAMTYGMRSMEYLNRGLALEPDNPRIQYLNGSYLLYVPEAFGGGADRAIEALAKAAALFEKETASDPLKPSWGKDESLTYLGMAFAKKNDAARARECFRKALAVNPAFGLAKSELAKIEK